MPIFTNLFAHARRLVTGNRSKPGVAKKGAAGCSPKIESEKTRDIAKKVEDMNLDYQVVLSRLTLESTIKSAQVTFSTKSEDPRAIAHVEHAQELWENSLDAMMEFIQFGRVAFEKCWRYDEVAKLSIIDQLDAMPYTDTALNLGESGEFNGFELKCGGQTEEICPDNSWWLALDPTPRQPHGRSRYMGAPYEVWKKRKKSLEHRDNFVRRFVIRGGIAHIPQTRVDPNTQQIVDCFSETAQALAAQEAGGYTLFPNDRDRDGNYLYDTSELNPTGLDPSPLNNVLDRQDVEMLRAFGIPEKVVIEGQAVGSFAMVTQQMAILYAVCDSILDQMVKSFRRYVLDKENEANYTPESGIWVEINYVPLSSRVGTSVLAELGKAIISGAAVSPLVLSGAIDLQAILDAAGIPLAADMADKLDEILADIRAQQQAVPGVPLQMSIESDETDGDDPPGEFGNISRLQQIRNFRSVDSILAKVVSGEYSSGMAVQALQMIGVAPGRAEAIIEEAVNHSAPRRDLAVKKKVPRVVPSRDKLTNESLRELNRLWSELTTEAIAIRQRGGKRTTARMKEILAAIEALYKDVSAAARVLGMASPWKPSLGDAPAGSGIRPQVVKNLAVPGVNNPSERLSAGEKWRFPFVENAVDFLKEKQIEIDTLPESFRHKFFDVEGITDGKLLSAIRAALTESAERGESITEFRQRLTGVVALPKAQSETLYRTETHQGYIAGLNEALDNPVIKAEFPYLLYVATSDNRVRDTHWDMDGEIALAGSLKHDRMIELLNDYNCRCVLIPLTARQAAQKGYNVTRDGFDPSGRPNLPKSIEMNYTDVRRLASGMRDDSRHFWKNEIHKYPKNGQLSFVVNRQADGKTSIQDGRHRLEAAAHAGWSHATGTVQYFNEDGDVIGTGSVTLNL